jgi:hypothetical protein
MNNIIIPSGGVSFETKREAYRGSVTVNGVRHRTRYCSTRRAAVRELNLLRDQLLRELTVKVPKSLRTLNNSMKTTSRR